MDQQGRTRRTFLTMLATAGAALACAGVAGIARSQADGERQTSEPSIDVTPTEDLMREHGVLLRVLLIYHEAADRLRAAKDFDPRLIQQSAAIVRTFIEDYHERLEEQELFPRFEQAGRLVDLVKVLRQQHDAGRRLTDTIRSRAAAGMGRQADHQPIILAMEQFIRMYLPHAAREDTVLFPALRSIVTPDQFHEMGEVFEAREQALFGEDGFNRIVAEIAEIEQAAGIGELSRFTP